MRSEFTLHRSEVIQQLVFPIATVAMLESRAEQFIRYIIYRQIKRILMGLCLMQLL